MPTVTIAFVNRVADKIIEVGLDNWADHVEAMDEDAIFTTAFDRALAADLVEAKNPYEELFEATWNHPAIGGSFHELKILVEDEADSAMQWNRAQAGGMAGMCRYYGVSMSDFL